MTTTVRPRVLAVLPGLFPSTIIGVGRPMVRLHRAGAIELVVMLHSLVTRAAVESADVLVMCRTIEPTVVAILAWAREAGVPLIYELDDNFLDIPPNVPTIDYSRAPMRRAHLMACLRQADLVRTYSPALQEVLQRYNPQVVMASGPLEWRMIPDPLPPRGHQGVRLVYATSRRQDEIGQMIVRPLLRILEKYPQTRLTIWGPTLEDLSRHPRVEHVRVVKDYERFFVRFARARYDIGLAPLPDEPFYRCKSNNKFREYAACSVAGVYSDMPVYNTSVVDGATGLLARDDENSWFTAIERLVNDAALRDRIQRDARAVARERYNEARTDAEWMSHLARFAGKHVRGAAVRAERGELRSRPVRTAFRLATRACSRAMIAVPTLWRSGWSETFRRARDHFAFIGEVLTWEFRRSQLEQRISNTK